MSLLATTAKENPQINKQTKKHAKPILQKARLATCLQTCTSICNPPLAGKGPSAYETSTLLILEYFPIIQHIFIIWSPLPEKMGRVTVHNVRNLPSFVFQLFRFHREITIPCFLIEKQGIPIVMQKQEGGRGQRTDLSL